MAYAQTTPTPSPYVGTPAQRWPLHEGLTQPPIQPRNQTPDQPSRRVSSYPTESAVTTSRSEDADDGVAPTQMENGASGMGARSPVVESASKLPAVTPGRPDRLKDILSLYETILGEQAHGRTREATMAANDEDGNARSHSARSPGRHVQDPVHHETAADATTSRGGSPQMPVQRGGKRRERVVSGGVQKKQKKRASTGDGQEYMILRLGDVRRREGKPMEWKAIWVPTWVVLEDLRGQLAFEEAEDLAVAKFGQKAWDEEALAAGL